MLSIPTELTSSKGSDSGSETGGATAGIFWNNTSGGRSSRGGFSILLRVSGEVFDTDLLVELDSIVKVVVTILIVGGRIRVLRSTGRGDEPYVSVTGLVNARYLPRCGAGASNRFMSRADA